MRPKRKREQFEDDEVFSNTRQSCCDGCKGSLYADESGCYEDCESFIREYDECRAEWLAEAELMTEPTENLKDIFRDELMTEDEE